MIMGIMTTDDDGHVESIVFFLTEALRAAVDSGDSVEQSLCEAPTLSPNMNCAEIADRLALYRKHLRAIWSYEVLMVAKIMRARELAKELRAMEPEFRPELDTFRLATVSCADLKELLMPSAQNLFNGIDHARAEDTSFFYDGARTDPLAGYRIAGHTDMRLLLSACESLHFALAARYNFDSLPSRYSDDALEEPLLLDDAIEGDVGFIHGPSFADVLQETSAAPGIPDWLINRPDSSALPN
jgi:hypothetical protein